MSVLERRAVWNWRVRGRDAPGVVQITQALLRHAGEHLPGPATGQWTFLDDDDVVRLGDGREDSRDVERSERPQVDHLGLDATPAQYLRRLERLVDAVHRRHDRHI